MGKPWLTFLPLNKTTFETSGGINLSSPKRVQTGHLSVLGREPVGVSWYSAPRSQTPALG